MAKKQTTNEQPFNELEEKLKKQYGSVTKMKFKVDGRELVSYHREPTLAELDATIASLSSAPISASVGMFRTTFVAGEDDLLKLADKAGLAIAINKEIQKILPIVLGESMSL